MSPAEHETERNGSVLKKQRIIYTTVILLILILSNCTTLVRAINGTSQYVCDKEENGKVVHLAEGESVTQIVRVADQAVTLGINLRLHGDVPQVAEIIVEQGETVLQWDVDVPKGTFYYFDLSGLKPGEFQVTVRPQAGNEISVGCSKDLTLGIAEELNGQSLRMSVSCRYRMPFLSYKVAALVLSLIAGAATCYLMLVKKQYRWIPILTFLTIFLQITCKYSSLVFGNEALKHIGSDYLAIMITDPLKGFFMDDAGYWCVFTKILCFFLVNVLHITTYAPLALSLVSVLITCGILSFITTERFSGIWNIQTRYFLAILLGCTQLLIVEGLMVTAFNFMYLGLFLLVLLYTQNLEKDNPALRPWMFLSGLLVMSKGTYVILIPVLAFVAVLCAKQKKWKTLRFTLYVETCLAVQVLYILFGPGGMQTQRALPTLTTLVQDIAASVWVYFVSTAKLLFRVNANTEVIPLLFLVIFLNIVALVYEIRLIRKKDRWGLILLGLHMAAFGHVLANMVGVNDRSFIFTNETDIGLEHLSANANYKYQKNVFSLHLFLLFYILHGFARLRDKTVLVVLSASLIVSATSLGSIDWYAANTHGNWTEYSMLLDRDSFAIPADNVEDKLYFAKQNSHIVYIGNKSVGVGHTLNERYHSDEAVVLEEGNGKSAYDLSEVDTAKQPLIALYGSKRYISQPDEIYCLLLGEGGEVLEKLPLITPDNQKVTGFGVIPENPVNGVRSVQFVYHDGTPATLLNSCYFVFQE